MINIYLYIYIYILLYFWVLDILPLENLDSGPAGLKHVADCLKTMRAVSQNDTFWCFLTCVLFTYSNFGTKPFLKVTAKNAARTPVIL